MKINIGISQKDREKSIKIMNVLLADESLLYTKVRNYHWHVTGISFMELHKFLEAQYEKVEEIVDQIAERIRTLDGQSLGTLKEFLENTRLKEQPQNTPDFKKMLMNLLMDHESIIVYLRKAVEDTDKNNDKGTSDFLTGLMEEHETMAWMLRSYLL